MSYKTFKSPCERMRFRALRDGDGSEADKAWRKHAAGCKECQASLHIMQLLQGTPSSEELSLPEENVAHLKQMVEERYGNGSKNRRQMVLSLLWRVGLVASIVFVAGHFLPLEHLLDKSVGTVAETVVSHGAKPAAAVAATKANEAVATAAAAEMSEFDDMMPMNQMDQSIEHVRSQIDYQFNELNDLIDRDLNEY